MAAWVPLALTLQRRGPHYHWHPSTAAGKKDLRSIPRTPNHPMPRFLYPDHQKMQKRFLDSFPRDIKSYQILQIICRAAAGAPTQGLIRGQECVHTAPSVFFPESNEHTSSTVRPSSSMSTAPASLLSDDPFRKRIDLCANPSHDDTNPNTCSFRYRGSASSTRHAPGDVEKTPM